MKILYNDNSLKKNFKHFKEWYFLNTGINAIKKKGSFSKSNFIGKYFFSLIAYIFVSIMMIDVYQSSDERFVKIFSIVLLIFSIFCIIISILALIGYFICYCNFKKSHLNTDRKTQKNSLMISEDGIADITDYITLSSKWEQLTHVLIGEYYIMIATTTNIAYIFPIDVKEKLITGINKYNSNKELKIIEKR